MNAHTTSLTELVHAFDTILGDDPLHDPATTIQVFSHLLNDIRTRKRRIYYQTTPIGTKGPTETGERPMSLQPITTPPPDYTNVTRKNSQ